MYSTENKNSQTIMTYKQDQVNSLCHTQYSLYSLFQRITKWPIKGFSVNSFSRFMCVMILCCLCETIKSHLVWKSSRILQLFWSASQKKKRERRGEILVWIITFFGKLKWFLSNDRRWKISIVFLKQVIKTRFTQTFLFIYIVNNTCEKVMVHA